MNGRVYDYNIGRFLSVDPLIQAPTSTQSINPYSYIMNNPLSGTDPTGYCSTDDTLKDCAGGLEAGKTQEITNSDGKTVGHIGKDSDGNVHITNNGSSKGQSAITNALGGEHSQIGSQKEIAKSSPESTNTPQTSWQDSNVNDVSEPSIFNGTETACVGGGAACTPASQSVNISLGYTDTPVGMWTNHALVIVTDPLTGEQYATRAGPSLGKTDEGGSGVGLGTIRAESGIYDKTFRDSPDKVHTTQHVGKLKITFAEAVSRMHEFANVTNSNLIPYRPSFNSNSYAFTFVESLGFKRPTPTVWSPGWESGRMDTKKLSYSK